ncbi:ABC transporter ATP-binding protein [Dethiobacter alkaliphilus]|uniref:ABC transporter ATP-binding protein n=1 Tax=Dethiobacter alkaliphilus TaxID=427926 RepID=UPI002227AD35|nr:ABC transporter ATP-binding protein [Dethiobacter alkaliphilus]MCW3490833.1 ABC transporter ATP-binding protein [Dethiobacter alkaliphilus]
MGAEPLVKIKNIGMRFHSPEGETAALKDFSLDIYPGEFISIVGPSGCGKSTLLNIVAGLIRPTEGEVVVNGKKVLGPTPMVGYMPQSDQLFEWRTIWKNVLLGLEVQNKINPETLEFVRRLLQRYGLYEFRNAYPSQLSGGMRQRAALIRTLAINPKILLLDEAFSALDYQTRLVVADEVKEIIVQEKKTAVLVTHDIAEAISMANRVVVFTKRPGTIKNIHDVVLSCEVNTPIKCRDAVEFKDYFNTIWKELDIHV